MAIRATEPSEACTRRGGTKWPPVKLAAAGQGFIFLSFSRAPSPELPNEAPCFPRSGAVPRRKSLCVQLATPWRGSTGSEVLVGLSWPAARAHTTMTLPPWVRNEGQYNKLAVVHLPPPPRPFVPSWTDMDRSGRAGGETLVLYYFQYSSRHLAALETCSALRPCPSRLAMSHPKKDKAAGPARPSLGGLRVIQYLPIYVDPLPWRIACEAAWTQHITGRVLLHTHPPPISNSGRPFPRFHLPFDLTPAPSIPVSF